MKIQAEQKLIRCAIYTRKSTDEGLDKEFNTLEAQREAGENYVKSQYHQGWKLLPDRYDDGGFSGGNINRPALKQLISDVEKGKIDMIVVYKIDRLTRSLSDFSKLIDILDEHNCSFVSVTQNFNTSDSMGRLTLNMLLSFAQFEREVGAERIRDKVAASRKKGMWMGGKVPFGYKAINKKLVINHREAEIVKEAFQKYYVYHSVRDVCSYLNSKGYSVEQGTDKLFLYAKVNHMLSNPIYKGMVVHKKDVYKGQHKSIISNELWDRVQRIKNGNRQMKQHGTQNRVHDALLQGMLECGCGCHSNMTVTRTIHNHKSYEYYVSLKAIREGYHLCELGNVPVGELNKFVLSKVQNILKSPRLIDEICKHLACEAPEIGIKELIENVRDPEHFFDYLLPGTIHQILEKIISRIIIYKDKLVIRLLPFGAMLLEVSQQNELTPSAEYPGLMELVYNVNFVKKRGTLKILPPAKDTPVIDETLLMAVVKAHSWKQKLETTGLSARELSKKEKISRVYMAKLAKLTYLAPDIIDSIIIGSQPQKLKLTDLINDKIPLSWTEQRKKYGFPMV